MGHPRKLTLAIPAIALGLIAADVAHAETTYFQELLINGDFETGDLTGWEEDNAYGGRKWEVLTGPTGASFMSPADVSSSFASPFNAGPVSMPWGTLLQQIDLESLTFPTIEVEIPGSASGSTSGPTLGDHGIVPDSTLYPTFDGSQGGSFPVTTPTGTGSGSGPSTTTTTTVPLVPTDRLDISVEAIYGYDRVGFEVRFLAGDGTVLRIDDLGQHGYLPDIGEGPWDGTSKLVEDSVLIPDGTRFISFWGRTELVNGSWLDAGFDNASLLLQLEPSVAVPEPASLGLLAAGGLLLRRRR
ncbi:MAG: PEP-CTERM sorting domain-containing protein [Planctomycetota bacterium]